MKSHILISLFFLIFCAVRLSADQLSDFRELFEAVVTAYPDAMKADKDSRTVDEFEKRMTELRNQARKMQDIIAKLRLEEVNLPQKVSLLYDAYTRDREKKNKSSNIEKTSAWYAISKMRHDLNELKSMGFSAENGTISKELKDANPLIEFRNLFSRYIKHIEWMAKASKESVWKSESEMKLSRLKELARLIQTEATKTDPKTKINLPKEVLYIADKYPELEKVYKDSILKSEERKLKAAQIEKDIMTSARIIDKYMAEVDSMQLKFAESPKEPNVPKDKIVAPEAKPTEKTEEKALDSYSEKELLQMIQDEKNRIINADQRLSNFSADTIAAYLQTLSREQRERYNIVLAKNQERGLETEYARSSAILDVHGYYRNNPGNISKKELISILKNIETYKQRVAEKEKSGNQKRGL